MTLSYAYGWSSAALARSVPPGPRFSGIPRFYEPAGTSAVNETIRGLLRTSPRSTVSGAILTPGGLTLIEVPVIIAQRKKKRKN